MRRIALISLTLLIALSSSASYAAKSNGGSSIPPNCTMNPWTGKLTCHKW